MIIRGAAIHKKYFYGSVMLLPLSSALAVRMHWFKNVNFVVISCIIGFEIYPFMLQELQADALSCFLLLF